MATPRSTVSLFVRMVKHERNRMMMTMHSSGNAIVASIAWNAPCRCNADIASMYAPASEPST